MVKPFKPGVLDPGINLGGGGIFWTLTYFQAKDELIELYKI